MERISTNRDTRRQQFRAIARGILDAARGPIGRPDRIGDLARAMERAYAAGAEQAGSVEEPPGIAGWVAWESMPRRSQEVLQEIAGEVRLHIKELRAGQLVAIVEGAGPTSPRGARARFSICHLDGDVLRKLDGLRGRDWPQARSRRSSGWVCSSPSVRRMPLIGP